MECRVCDDKFALQGDKVPRLLNCGHTICHSCLLHLNQQDNTIQCPFDRQSTAVGTSGVGSLKKNFALIELFERIQNSHQTVKINAYCFNFDADKMKQEEKVMCQKELK